MAALLKTNDVIVIATQLGNGANVRNGYSVEKLVKDYAAGERNLKVFASEVDATGHVVFKDAATYTVPSDVLARIRQGCLGNIVLSAAELQGLETWVTESDKPLSVLPSTVEPISLIRRSAPAPLPQPAVRTFEHPSTYEITSREAPSASWDNEKSWKLNESADVSEWTIATVFQRAREGIPEVERDIYEWERLQVLFKPWVQLRATSEVYLGIATSAPKEYHDAVEAAISKVDAAFVRVFAELRAHPGTRDLHSKARREATKGEHAKVVEEEVKALIDKRWKEQALFPGRPKTDRDGAYQPKLAIAPVSKPKKTFPKNGGGVAN